MQAIRTLGTKLSQLSERFMPDPWVLALFLTALTFVLAVSLTPTAPADAARMWMGGFWQLLEFGMQMVLILMTGHVVATSPLVSRRLSSLAGLPRTGSGAALLVAAVSSLGALLNWGLGLVAGAILVREIGRTARAHHLKLHYPLLGAAGYAGLSVWHGGLSGSAPLLVATPGHFLESEMGVLPVARTLGSPLNLVTTSLLVLVMMAVFWALHPDEEEALEAPHVHVPPERSAEGEIERSFVARLEHAPLVGWIAGGAGLAALLYEQVRTGWHLDLNTMNFALLFAGIFLHGTVAGFLAACVEGVRGTVGVVVQFPFYAGIMGLMRASGLAALFSAALSSAASAETLPLLMFFSAGFVNLFVPSGGGQWAVQGPIAIEAARGLGVPLEKMVLAVAYGDQWTNLIQPFWALPLLGVTGLKAKQMMGYTFGALIATGVVYTGALLFF